MSPTPPLDPLEEPGDEPVKPRPKTFRRVVAVAVLVSFVAATVMVMSGQVWRGEWLAPLGFVAEAVRVWVYRF